MSEHVYAAPRESVGEPLVAGHYRVNISGAVQTKSKAGNEMIELTLTVDEPKSFAGRNLREYLVFGPKTGWKIDQVLAAIAAATEEGVKLDVVPETFLGESGIVRVEMEPDRNDSTKEWPRVKTWLWGDRADEAELGPLDKWAPTKQAEPVAKAAEVGKAPAADDNADDDIPF